MKDLARLLDYGFNILLLYICGATLVIIGVIKDIFVIMFIGVLVCAISIPYSFKFDAVIKRLNQ